jgi:uncharacterized protein YchJ
MNHTYKIFVGYFSKNHTKKKVAQYVLKSTSHATTISVHSTPCGISGQVYYCCLGFPKKNQAEKAVKALLKNRYHQMQLLVRPWIERTAANERRLANWRDQDRDGPERRKEERRHYHHPRETTRARAKEQIAAAAANLAEAAQKPPPDHSSYLVSEVVMAKDPDGQASMPESALSDSSIVIRGKF